MQAHIVWVTKYRYQVLRGEIQKRCRDLIVQICDAEDIQILKGVVSKDHIHMHIEYPPNKSISDIVKKLKGRTSRKLQINSGLTDFPAEIFSLSDSLEELDLSGNKLKSLPDDFCRLEKLKILFCR